LQDYLKKCKIMHQRTVPYAPEQNGVEERANRMTVQTEKAVHVPSNEGFEVVKWQRGDSDRSEAIEEIDSTGEQVERRSVILESEYRKVSNVIT
jgi:hypothetical protein